MNTYYLTGTKAILNWMHANLKKYETRSNSKTIAKLYTHEKFNIKIYTSGLVEIKGNISKRVYSKLIEQSNETDFLGSDEVGVGDFFGPVVYVSVLFDQKTLTYLKENPITIKDSKKLKDSEIIYIYMKIKDQITFSSEITYDNDIQELNSIAQKVYYHYKNINKFKNTNYLFQVIDQFTTEKAFFKYSLELGIEWDKNKLILETKADSKYLTVALASIIARGIFLNEMAALENKYNFKFPLGANNVKDSARKFIQKYSKDELKLFAKTSFKTYKELEKG